MLPPWLKAWRSSFERGRKTRIFVVRQDDLLLGIAPLIVDGDTAFLVGDSDLIDYSDFITAHLRERDFFLALLQHLRGEGIRCLDAGRLRADSLSLSFLRTHSPAPGCKVTCSAEDTLYEMTMPESWEEYLGLLSGRERHETRRKLRRLESSGRVAFRVVENTTDIQASMETFVGLFRSSSGAKARFMTGPVESFFRSLAAGMSDAGLLRLCFLDVNDTPVASVMCFDYGGTFYLYNNGYDRSFGHLSVGLLSKVFSIREAVMRGRKRYNFLRGSEAYKLRLGGRPVKLVHCEVLLK